MSTSNEQAPQRPLDFERLEEDEMQARAKAMYQRYDKRRTVRHFSQDPLPLEVVRKCILAAGTAPSGALGAVLAPPPLLPFVGVMR